MRCSLMQEETGKDEAQQRVKWSDIERRYEEERGQQMMEETGKDEAQQRVKWSDIERRYEEERGQQMMENIV